jgi:hypothetical protein
MGLCERCLRLPRTETKALQRLTETFALRQPGEHGVSRHLRIPAAQVMSQSGGRDELTKRQMGIGRQRGAILAPQSGSGHVHARRNARMLRPPSLRAVPLRAGRARPVQACVGPAVGWLRSRDAAHVGAPSRGLRSAAQSAVNADTPWRSAHGPTAASPEGVRVHSDKQHQHEHDAAHA